MEDVTPVGGNELERLLAAPEAEALMDALMLFTPTITAVVSAPDMRVLRVSSFAGKITGRRTDELERVSFEAFSAAVRTFHTDGRPMRMEERPLYRAACGELVADEEAFTVDLKGEFVPVICNAAPIRNPAGQVIGGIVACTDVRKLKALEHDLRLAVDQKETLFRELAHRVKNHLQIMSGLIALDARSADLTAAEMGERSQGRLQMLAAVYDSLTQAADGQRIETPAFVEAICRPYRTELVRIEIEIDPPDLTLSSDQAAPFGMLLNEAVCNAYKHAFPGRSGVIRVSLRRAPPRRLSLEVADDGVGRPEQPGGAAPSHGIKLMAVQAQQLKGTLDLADRPGGGTVVRLMMPEADGKG